MTSDEVINRINCGEVLVMPLRAMNQIDPERCASFTMRNVTLDGHDYHIHEDIADRSVEVVCAHDLHRIGYAHQSPCGEYWLVELDDDIAAPFGTSWQVHVNSINVEELSRSIIAAAAY